MKNKPETHAGFKKILCVQPSDSAAAAQGLLSGQEQLINHGSLEHFVCGSDANSNHCLFVF